VEGKCVYCLNKGIECSTKISKTEYRDRSPSDDSTQVAQALAFIECFLKSIKLGDSKATDDMLLAILKKGIEAKERQIHSRKRRGTTEDIGADEVKSEPLSVNIMAATPPPRPAKKPKIVESTLPPGSSNADMHTNRATYQSDAFEDPLFPETASLSSSASSLPSSSSSFLDTGVTNTGGTLSLHLDAVSNNAETSIRHTCTTNDDNCFDDFVSGLFNWDGFQP
jgi:hypothetical protein